MKKKYGVGDTINSYYNEFLLVLIIRISINCIQLFVYIAYF